MRIDRRVLWILTLALVLPARQAGAGERGVTFRPDHTTISWTLDATGHDVHGTFKLISGEIMWDPETGDARGRIEIDATSATTGNRRRDRTMHEDVLESDRYPTFVLTATKVQGTVKDSGQARVNLHGVLSIHGEEHPIVLPAEVNVVGETMRVSTSMRIPFVEWGMKDPSMLFLRVAKEVEVDVTASATMSP